MPWQSHLYLIRFTFPRLTLLAFTCNAASSLSWYFFFGINSIPWLKFYSFIKKKWDTQDKTSIKALFSHPKNSLLFLEMCCRAEYHERWTLGTSAKINAWIHLGMHSFFFSCLSRSSSLDKYTKHVEMG